MAGRSNRSSDMAGWPCDLLRGVVVSAESAKQRRGAMRRNDCAHCAVIKHAGAGGNKGQEARAMFPRHGAR